MNAVANQKPGLLRTSWNALNSVLLAGLIIAGAGWAFQVHQTREAARQTANLERISDFTADAAATDRAVVRFFDAAAEGQDLSKARDGAQQALVDHSIKVESMRDVFGQSSSEQYLRAIERLQNEIEATKDATHAGPNVTALGREIQLRRSLVEKAREEN